jgi:hypothetical protein
LQAHLPAGPVLDVEELERRVRRHCRRRRDDSTTLAPGLLAGHVKLNAVAPVREPTGSTGVSARQRAQTGPVILPVFAATRSWPTNLGGACLDRILWTELPPGFVPEGATARLAIIMAAAAPGTPAFAGLPRDPKGDMDQIVAAAGKKPVE